MLGNVRVYSDVLGLSPEDRVSLLPRYGTDAGVMDIYGALLAGARLVMLDVRRDAAEQLLERLDRHGVSVLHATPTVYRYLLSAARGAQSFSRLRWVVLGGEEARSSDVALCRRHFPPGCRFINGLGPTESTMALQHIVEPHEQPPDGVLPVGHPVAGCDVRLLNEAGDEVGTLAEGRITIFSDRVARGYWQDQRSTEAAFIADPAPGFAAKTAAGACTTAPSSSPGATTVRSSSVATGSNRGNRGRVACCRVGCRCRSGGGPQR